MATPIEDLVEDVIASIEAGTIPMLWGMPGLGKTAVVNGISKRLGLPMHTLIGSLCDPTDINGFPVVSDVRVEDDKGTKHPVLEFAPRRWLVEMSKTGGILFIDELTSSPPAVQAALLRSMLDKVFGDFPLDPAKVAIIAAGNSADIAANGQELPAPMVNRLDHHHFPMGDGAAREWAESFSNYWGNPPEVRFGDKSVSELSMSRARSFVSGFIIRFPNRWHEMPGDADAHTDDKKTKRAVQTDDGQSGWPSPRSWDRVSRHIGWCIEKGLPPIESMRRVMAAVGSGAATELTGYIRETAIPDPETLLQDPDKFTPSGRPDLDFAILAAVAGAVEAKLDSNRFLAGMTVISRAFGGTGNKTGNIAYEAAAPSARRLLKLIGANTETRKTIVESVPGKERSGFTLAVQKCVAPFDKLMKSLNINF